MYWKYEFFFSIDTYEFFQPSKSLKNPQKCALEHSLKKNFRRGRLSKFCCMIYTVELKLCRTFENLSVNFSQPILLEKKQSFSYIRTPLDCSSGLSEI